MSDAFTARHYHIVFSTKYRRPWISDAVAVLLYRYIGRILKEQPGVLLAASGMPDHIHLLMALSQRRSISEAVRAIKSNSSLWLHRTFADADDFAWQIGYGAFSVDRSSINRVKRYIARQREHHGGVTYRQEFVGLLRVHNVSFDERFLWD